MIYEAPGQVIAASQVIEFIAKIPVPIVVMAEQRQAGQRDRCDRRHSAGKKGTPPRRKRCFLFRQAKQS